MYQAEVNEEVQGDGAMEKLIQEERLARMEKRRKEWEGRRIARMIVLDMIEEVEHKIVNDKMKVILEDKLEEATKEGQFKRWLRDIEAGGPIIRNRVELYLRSRRIEEGMRAPPSLRLGMELAPVPGLLIGLASGQARNTNLLSMGLASRPIAKCH